MIDHPVDPDTISGDPVTTYLHAQYGAVPEEVQSMADHLGIAHFDHFWSYNTTYPEDNNEAGDLSALKPFIERIESFAADHRVYDVDISMDASRKGLNHEAWMLYDTRDDPDDERFHVFDRRPWKDSLFETELRWGMVNGFELELVGYYVRNTDQDEQGTTPIEAMIDDIELLCEEHTIIDMQRDFAVASDGVYHDIWVFYTEGNA